MSAPGGGAPGPSAGPSAGQSAWPRAGLDPQRPSIARVYDFLLGGKDHYAVDREFADRLLRMMPGAERIARHNRDFLQRAVVFLAGDVGIDQFVDVGAGLPTAENTHEVAQRYNTDARVLYVDNDELVLSHGRALLAQEEQTAIVAADMREVGGILAAPRTRELIDLSRPVGLVLASVLHFVPGDDAAQITDAWWEVLAPGSYLVISHGEAGPAVKGAAELYEQQMNTGMPRNREQIVRLFAGFELVPPGLVPVPLWRPRTSVLAEGAESVPLLGGVGRRIIGGRRAPR